MFTGLIEEVGTVEGLKREEGSLNLEISASFASQTRVDQSICVNGVCLTVTGGNEEAFEVQCVGETLRKTSLDSLEEGDPVNLERSMQLKDGIEGHLVQGHVDCVGIIREIAEKNTDRLYEIEYPPEYTDLLVPRGSIATDGISLTVARIGEKNRFTVAIIPYTFEHTNLSKKKIGDPVHLEFDMIGKYVVKYLRNRQADSDETNEEASKPEDITASWLKKRGY